MGSTSTGWSREFPRVWDTYSVGAKASVVLGRCARGCWLQLRSGTGAHSQTLF